MPSKAGVFFFKIKQTARLLLVTAVLLLFSQVTDADLLDREEVVANTVRATTLDFSNKDTANETGKSLFFSVQGFIPTGFQVETVRVKNEGELAVTYELSVQQTAGDTQFCSALKLRVLSDWQTKYSDTLLGLQFSSTILEGQKSDLIFVLSFDDANTSLTNATCAFNIRVASLQTVNGERVQFFDEEILQNQITAGTWSSGG